jgi:hypothetical protein
MKILTPVLAAGLAAATALVAPPARAQDYVYMVSAGEMRGMIDQGKKDMAVGYIAGIMDTMMRTRDFCVPEGASAGDIGARAYKLMGQQPRESMAPAADVIGVFLHGDYPCRK